PAADRPLLRRRARARGPDWPVDDDFCGPPLAAPGAPLGRWRHEPSPYADYNGAGLLYFAAYPTIADTAERRLVAELALSPRPQIDWALATSTVRRDIFFTANLPLGEALFAELAAF